MELAEPGTLGRLRKEESSLAEEGRGSARPLLEKIGRSKYLANSVLNALLVMKEVQRPKPRRGSEERRLERERMKGGKVAKNNNRPGRKKAPIIY